MTEEKACKPMCKTFPVEIYKHGVKVVFGTHDDLKKALNKDGFTGDFEEEKDMMEKCMGITFTLETDDVVIWLRERPKDNADWAVLAHEIYHAVSFLLRGVGIDHTSDTEEAYAYAYENLYYSRITSWACS